MRTHLIAAALLLASLTPAGSLRAAEEDSETKDSAVAAFVPQPGEPTAVAAALPAPVTSLYVPPTRSDRPLAATATDVWFLDGKTRAWARIYTATPARTPIRLVTGYAKSSKALYVVHGGGIAATRDAGESWIEAAPSAFSSAELVGLTVHPTDRRTALLAVQGATWKTVDQGTTWIGYELPGAAEKGVGLEFVVIREKPAVVYATDKSVYLSSDNLRSWTTLSRQPDGPAHLATGGHLAATLSATGSLQVYDLSRPGYVLKTTALPGFALTLDAAGNGAAFFAGSGQIAAMNLHDEDATVAQLAATRGVVTHLQPHPRLDNAVYWADGAEVYVLTGALKDLEAAPLPVDRFDAGESAATAAVAGDAPEDVNKRAQEILDGVLAKQPPIEEVVAAGLKYANYHPKEAEQWKRNVRRKNLIPQLVLRAGGQERAMDRYGRVTNTDRFGAETEDDVREDQGAQMMDEYGVELRWNLSGLVFDRDQLMVSKEARERADQRNELITQISELYYARIELLTQMALNTERQTVADVVQQRLRLRQMTTTLNEIVGESLFDEDAK